MQRFVLGIILLLFGVTAASAQFWDYDPNYRGGGYRWRPSVVCYVFRGYEQYRSRPDCELSRYQPPGTSCSCPSYDGGRLPGRVGPR